MNVLDTENLRWSEVCISGRWPCARHSHAMVAVGAQLFVFGGHDGAKALGELHSFDVKTLQWKTEKTTGRAPFPRFSHSMFVYEDYLGIIGGCPVRQQYQELSLLNLTNHVWVHVTIESFSRELWVRSSTCVVDDELVIIGGGASCYAFGTKFNQPMKINLQVLESIFNLPSRAEWQTVTDSNKTNFSSASEPKNWADKFSFGNGHSADTKKFALQVEKKYAKFAKDVTKRFGWLDLSRKVQPSQDGCYICLPITQEFHHIIKDKQHTQVVGSGQLDHFQQDDAFQEDLSVNEVSPSTALSILLSYGCSSLVDNAALSRMLHKSPRKVMRESVCSLLTHKGMPLQLLEQLPARFDLSPSYFSLFF